MLASPKRGGHFFLYDENPSCFGQLVIGHYHEKFNVKFSKNLVILQSFLRFYDDWIRRTTRGIYKLQYIKGSRSTCGLRWHQHMGKGRRQGTLCTSRSFRKHGGLRH